MFHHLSLVGWCIYYLATNMVELVNIQYYSFIFSYLGKFIYKTHLQIQLFHILHIHMYIIVLQTKFIQFLVSTITSEQFVCHIFTNFQWFSYAVFLCRKTKADDQKKNKFVILIRMYFNFTIKSFLFDFLFHKHILN